MTARRNQSPRRVVEIGKNHWKPKSQEIFKLGRDGWAQRSAQASEWVCVVERASEASSAEQANDWTWLVNRQASGPVLDNSCKNEDSLWLCHYCRHRTVGRKYMKLMSRKLGHSLVRLLVGSNRSLIRLLLTARFAHVLHSRAHLLAHSLAPELMGKRFLSIKRTRWLHTIPSHCAVIASQDGGIHSTVASIFVIYPKKETFKVW